MKKFLKIIGIIFLVVFVFGIIGSRYVTHQTYFALLGLIGFVNLGFSKIIDILENKNTKE